jgi:hypothetical protein
MDGIKGMKFPKKPSLSFPKFSSSENKPNDTSLPTSSSTPERDGLRHPSSDDSGQQEEQINSGNNESEKHSKLKFPVGLASIDLDPLRVKDQMGRLGGKMKSSLNKMSDKIPSSKKSSNEIDEFDKVIQNIENDELKKNNEITPPETSSGTELQREQQQEQEEHDHHKTKSVVAQITNVKGKLNKLGKAAKQRLSSIHQSSPFNVEENDSAHSSASKDSNNSLTATARLSRAFPVLLPSTSANLDNSSDPPHQPPSSPHSRNPSSSTLPQDSHQTSSAVLVDELLEMWIDVDREEKEKEESDQHHFSSPSKLSRRPSEYLEFENSSSSALTQAPTAPPAPASSSANGNNNDTNGVATSHTPFLYPKVKKLSFLKSSPSPNSTPPLPVDPSELTPDEADPYYQPYGSHHHPPSLSKPSPLSSPHLLSSPRPWKGGAKHWVEKKILNKRNVHHLHSDQQTTDFFLQTETVEDDNCV